MLKIGVEYTERTHIVENDFVNLANRGCTMMTNKNVGILLNHNHIRQLTVASINGTIKTTSKHFDKKSPTFALSLQPFGEANDIKVC